MKHRTGQLFFKDGRFFEKVKMGCNEWSYYDEELQDITEEVMNCVCQNLNNRNY